jgi:hypothetical protein
VTVEAKERFLHHTGSNINPRSGNVKPHCRRELDPAAGCGYPRLVRLACLILACVLPALGAGNAALFAGLRHEPGVETRLLAIGHAGWQPLPPLTITANLGAALAGNPGLAHAGLSARARILARPELGFTVGVAREQWPDWRAAEHRLRLELDCSPLDRLTLGAGLARRIPVLGAGWQNPFDWSSPVAEWNLRYLVDWRFLDRPGALAGAYVGHFSDLFPPTAQQFPFGAHAALRLGPGWQLLAEAGGAMKGLSAVLFSLGEVRCRIGVGRAL